MMINNYEKIFYELLPLDLDNLSRNQNFDTRGAI